MPDETDDGWLPVYVEGLVELRLGPTKTQMLPFKAREIAAMLLECAGAAEGDEVLVTVLDRSGMSRQRQAQVLRCSGCGHAMIGAGQARRTAAYYRCPGSPSNRRGAGICDSRAVRAQLVEAIATSEVSLPSTATHEQVAERIRSVTFEPLPGPGRTYRFAITTAWSDEPVVVLARTTGAVMAALKLTKMQVRTQVKRAAWRTIEVGDVYVIGDDLATVRRCATCDGYIRGRGPQARRCAACAGDSRRATYRAHYDRTAGPKALRRPPGRPPAARSEAAS